MKRSFFAYIILALSVVSCMNAETAPSGDDLLSPELQLSAPSGSTRNFKVLFQAKQSLKIITGDCGFYLSSSSDFSNSEKVKADNVSKSDGTFSVTKKLRDYGTKYYCKAYSSNGRIEICSSVGSYTVKDFASYVSAGKPEVRSTIATKTILKYSISVADGITLTDCGLCYGKTREELSVESAHISGGTSAGEHTAIIDGLTTGQSYYACSYVREKDNIAYGEAVSFVACDAPTISTVAPSDVAATSAVCGGNGIDSKGSEITDKGVVWSTEHNPELSSSTHVSAGSASDSFTCTISGLSPVTTYYVRAYVKNAAGVGYGEEQSFTTKSIPVTGASLSQSSISIAKYSSYTLTASVLPENATDKSVSWESSNAAVATVSDGVVTGIAVGSATITVRTSDGDKTASCSVEVIQQPTDVTVSPTTLTLSIGKTSALSATVLPSDAAQSVIWSSSDSSIASVSSSGVVTAVSGGTATITATTTNDLKASCSVTVTVPVTGVSLCQSSISIAKNSSYTLTASVLPENATDKSVKWESSNTAVATVSGGVVTGIAVGSATITVRTSDGDKTAICSMKVIDAVDLSSVGTANCYIVNKAGNYMFKATVKGGSTESVGTPLSAKTLWESFGTDVTPNVGDIVSNVSYSDGYICFSTPSTLNNGNAVIAVKDASSTILWSWHIWVCDGFDAAATAQVYNNGAGTMMDRNLGATSATPGDVHALGLLYQWGRKDPFLSGCQISFSSYLDHQQASSTVSWPGTVPSNSSNGTIAYAVAHPTTFITYNSSNSDWYYTGSSSTDNTRWQTSDKTKGIYDPCPKGWRVPYGGDSGVWSKAFGTSSYYYSGPWDIPNYGMNFGSGNGKSSSMQLGDASTIWYPTAGYRRSDNGSLSYVGNDGYYWSCTLGDRIAYDFYFGCDGRVFPSPSSTRAFGRSVRCLSE